MLAGKCITLRAEYCIEKFRKNYVHKFNVFGRKLSVFLIVPFVIGIIKPNSTCVILS